jgi:hypothetical protein
MHSAYGAAQFYGDVCNASVLAIAKRQQFPLPWRQLIDASRQNCLSNLKFT